MATASNWTIKDKVCIVTGSNTGIGRQTALELAKRGAAKVILACRNVQAAEDAAKDIRQQVGYANEAEGSKRVFVKQLDLASLESVRKFAAEIISTEPALHVLVNNAGLECVERQKSVDGFELTLGVNHLGPFLLTNLLLDLLKKSAPSRIIVLSSGIYRWRKRDGFDFNDPNLENQPFDAMKAYSQSKLANILFVHELHRRLNERAPSGISVFAVHPGLVKSDFIRNRRNASDCMSIFVRMMFAVGGISVEQGALTSLHCACEPGIEGHSGKYFAKSKVEEVLAVAKDDENAKKLWQLSENLTKYRS